MPKDIRTAGLEGAREARARPPAASAESSADSSASSPDAVSVLEGAAAAAPSDSDEVTADGWVRRKVVSKVAKAARGNAMGSGLSVFRVNLTRWSGHNQYQVLAFSGGRLSAGESGKRKHPTCTAVDAVDMDTD